MPIKIGNMALVSIICLILAWFPACKSASKIKPHGHQGVLQPYDGRPLPDHLTNDQKSNLDKGESVIYNERDGKSGYGVVVQDINATNVICMNLISNIKNYPKMVPHIKSVDIYEKEQLANGSTRVGAQFNVGLMGLSFGYFLKLRHEPKYNTLTWTQDYRYSSDFDDNVGHWQVMPHPSRSGWTRLLYSCKVKLLPWIPEFVVSFLTASALTELCRYFCANLYSPRMMIMLKATAWVKKEAEAVQRNQLAPPPGTISSTSTSAAAATPSGGLRLPKWLSGLKGGGREEALQRVRQRVKAQQQQQQQQQQGLCKQSLWGLGARLRLPGKFGKM